MIPATSTVTSIYSIVITMHFIATDNSVSPEDSEWIHCTFHVFVAREEPLDGNMMTAN